MTARGEVTVGEFFDRWAELSVGRKPETQRHNAALVRAFAVEHERLPLSGVEAVDAQAWAVDHPGQVRYLKLFFGDAVRLGLCASSPFAATLTAAAGKRDRTPPSGSELDRICSEASPALREVIRVASGTGLRLSEIAAVHREHVQQVPLFRVRIPAGKGGKPRTVGAFREARDVLGDLCSRRVGPLFVQPQGARWCRRSVSAGWRRAADAAGFAGSFHTCRHFFAGWALSNGVSEIDLAIQLGHVDAHGRANTDLIRKVYGRPDPERSLERLDERLGA